MRTPRIGLTTYARDGEGRFTLYAAYVDAVRRAGGLPLLLAPGEEQLGEWLELCDGIVLTGGGDLAAELYGADAPATSYGVDAERDATELEFVRHTLTAGKPVFCICRGAQVLNVCLGGTLVTHLPERFGDAVPHRDAQARPVPHAVRLEPDTLVARLSGTLELTPISWHHQAVEHLGAGLEVAASAPDGVVEAVQLATHPWCLAVQWHPELSAANDPTQQDLFDALVREARGPD